MSQIQYHLVDPESTMVPFDNTSSSGGYTPFQTIDFNLATPGRKLLKNSIRIEGRIVARNGGAGNWAPETAGLASSAVTFSDNIKIDNVVGAHAFFDSFTCVI